MLQRVQSIYLLISLIAWGLLFFNPIVGLTDQSGGSWVLVVNGIQETGGGKIVLPAIPMVILMILVEVLAVAALFAYRRRALQLRITVLNMLLQFLSYGIIALYVFQGRNQLHAQPALLFWSAMPLVACISSYLAFRGIRRDILLLRAQDRLR